MWHHVKLLQHPLREEREASEARLPRGVQVRERAPAGNHRGLGPGILPAHGALADRVAAEVREHVELSRRSVRYARHVMSRVLRRCLSGAESCTL